MTVIFGTFRDIGGELSQGNVTLQSIITRPSHLSSSEVVTTERHEIVLRNGAFTSPELDPGPTRVHFRGNGGSEEWEITLPEDGRHDLATLVESQHVYKPPVVGAAQAAAQDAVSARVAAELARDGAVDAADRAEGAAGGVAADAAAAGDAAGRAEVAADAAAADAAAAGVSAGEAAASAEATAVDAATVGETREYVSGLHADLSPGGAIAALLDDLANGTVDAADQAGLARDAAAGHADRAEAAADGVDQVVANAAAALAVELGDVATQVADDADAAQAARDGAEAARDETSGMLAQKADLVGGVVPSSQIPAVAMTRPHVVADRAGLLALNVQEGDVGIIPDGADRGSFMLGTGPASEFSSWKRLVTPEAPVSSVNGQTGTITLGAADVGAATAGDVAAVTGRVSTLESSRPTRTEMQARPAFWLWDGAVPWTPPTHAQPGDSVLNTETMEIHRVEEVV